MSFEGYTNASTIHGVSYFTSEKAPLAKLFWLLCVFAGLLTATGIVYLNIVGWTENPGVVTTVDIVDVQVG